MIASASARTCKNKNTCKNGGQCNEVVTIEDDDGGATSFVPAGFECICKAGYTGKRCEYVDSPHNWISFGEKDYLYVESPKLKFGAAQKACELAGGNLATINSVELEELVANMVPDNKKQNGRWIGLKRNKVGKFFWESGNVELDRHDYSAWFPGNPGINVDQCVIQDTKGTVGWLTAKCKDERSYVCEKDTVSVASKKRRNRRRRPKVI
jgi:hypothetical protein